MAQQKILLAQLNSNGDCLYATVIARQIKEIDYPGCHLTWAINSHCKQSILLNPHVDEIWEIPTERSLTGKEEWHAFTKAAETKKAAGDFNVIFYTQIIGKNFIRLNGDIRSSIYKNYPHAITALQQPVIKLSAGETENVKLFAEKNKLEKYRHVILVECGPESFRSSLNPAAALSIAKDFTSADPGIAFILSSNKKIKTSSPQIIDGSVLGFRENADLTKYCSFFIGCSSGISWLTTTDWAKPLKKIIVINDRAVLNSSMAQDHAVAGLSTDNIIELHENNSLPERLKDCLQKALSMSFEEARKIYHQPFRRKNFKYLYYVAKSSFEQKDFITPFKAFRESIKKDGFRLNAFFYLVKAYIKLPFYLVRNSFKKTV